MDVSMNDPNRCITAVVKSLDKYLDRVRFMVCTACSSAENWIPFEIEIKNIINIRLQILWYYSITNEVKWDLLG